MGLCFLFFYFILLLFLVSLLNEKLIYQKNVLEIIDFDYV